jgi:hypothetical protein
MNGKELYHKLLQIKALFHLAPPHTSGRLCIHSDASVPTGSFLLAPVTPFPITIVLSAKAAMLDIHQSSIRYVGVYVLFRPSSHRGSQL